MKNIWLISYQLDGVAAGPSIRFQRYAEHFQNNGYRLTFVTKRINNLPHFEKRDKFDIVRIGANFRFLHHTLFIFKALLLAIKRRKEINTVLTFSITTLSIWLLPLIKLVKLPVFYINTMALSQNFISGYGAMGKLYNLLHVMLYGILYRNINGIVTSTDALKSSFTSFNLPSHKLIKIYNGVNVDTFKPVSIDEKLETRKKLGLSEHQLIFLFVGLKTERKGLRDLLEAWESWPESSKCQLVLIGDNKPEANPESFNAFWNNYLNNKIPNSNIVNRENQKNVVDYFKAADCFVFLSQKEGMPNVLLEAMSCGLPVILTEFEGFSKDYGHHGAHYISVKRDKAEIINSLNLIYTNAELRTKIGEQAHQKMYNEFKLANSIKAYTNLFELKSNT
ncbi:MAG: glycosyltransferase family 4 protein [Bacteroidia bacterium]|nr:glycosyltransferase family 4 protein [Bacteroidia bacterium]